MSGRTHRVVHIATRALITVGGAIVLLWALLLIAVAVIRPQARHFVVRYASSDAVMAVRAHPSRRDGEQTRARDRA